MKNLINYYYNLYPEKIYQNENNYYFFINKIRYSFVLLKEEIDLNRIYYMHLNILNSKMYVHPIILNKDNYFVTQLNEKKYILMQTLYYDRKINIEDLFLFNKTQLLSKNPNWQELWSKKNDYIEYQINRLENKYKIIKNSINYYLGLGENAIELINITNPQNIPMYYSHRRIDKKSTTYDFYNPLNIIIDSKVRDVAEYLKQKFFIGEDINKDLDFFLTNTKLNTEEYILFLARMLYPTYYYDLFEKIIKNKAKEMEIFNITNKVTEYENIIKKIYKYYKSFIKIPEIEWLE